MRIPLFIEARPSIGLTSPSVTLRAGRWKLASTGDATVFLNGELQAELDLIESTVIVATVSAKGLQTSLTVYMELCP